MSKQTNKKATFKDLLNKKILKEKNSTKVKEIEISSMGKSITFVRPKDDVILDVIDLVGEGKSTRDMVNAFKTLIYHSCPMLQDTELHEQLEIQDPYDVVDTIFELADILEIGQELLEMVDINGKVDDIKN